jgi:hypothetical protein
MAAIALALTAGLQMTMPSSLDLPLAARRAAHPVTEAEAAAPQVYAAIMAHPIFAPDRAPPPAEAEGSGNLSGVQAVGTAIAGKSSAAALVRDAGGTMSRIKIGDVVQGWKLVSIQERELVFDRNGERRSLTVDIARPAVRPGGELGSSGSGSGGTISGSSDNSDDDDSDE